MYAFSLLPAAQFILFRRKHNVLHSDMFAYTVDTQHSHSIFDDNHQIQNK